MAFDIPGSFTVNGWIRWRNEQWALAKKLLYGRAPTLRYYQETGEDPNFILEFGVVGGHVDPTMVVRTGEPTEGIGQLWPRYERDGVTIFLPSDDYAGGPIIWRHDERFVPCQITKEVSKAFAFADGTRGGGHALAKASVPATQVPVYGEWL